MIICGWAYCASSASVRVPSCAPFRRFKSQVTVVLVVSISFVVLAALT